jgi:hypothetical protein
MIVRKMTRREAYLYSVFGVIATLSFLAMVPIMIWWPEKPDWPAWLVALTYMAVVLMALIPGCVGFIALRTLVRRDWKDP